MQTFLPYPSFADSARCLDRSRLGKQRLECLQLVRAITASSRTGWSNHPAARMWRGYATSLCRYGIAVCREWRARGYDDGILRQLMTSYGVLLLSGAEDADPPWLGREDFHASHRSNLLRKDPTHYGRFGWEESPDLPYIWPV